MCYAIKTVASIVVLVGVRVCASSGSGGLRNTRIIEGTQWFILLWADRCPTSSSWWSLYSRAPKIWGLQQSVREKERDLVGDRSVLILGCLTASGAFPLTEEEEDDGAVEELLVPLSRLLYSRCRAWAERWGLEWSAWNHPPPLRIRPSSYILR